MGFELGTDGPRVIVVGYDGTEPAEHALAYASGLARRAGARLVVAFASPAFADGAIGAVAATADPGLAGAMVGLRADVQQQAAAVVADCAVTWQYVSGRGDAVRMIEDVAERTHADAIVVGRSQRREHRLAGSVAVRLAKTSRWPVTVVP